MPSIVNRQRMEPWSHHHHRHHHLYQHHHSGRSPNKKMLSFGFCPNYLPPPNLDNLYNFFLTWEIQDLKVSLGLKMHSLKFKLLAFWKKWTPLLSKNAPLEKVRKKFGQGPPSPSFGQNPKESVFSQENVRPLAASVASSLMHRIVNRQRIELRFKERSERRRRKLPAISSENFFNHQNGSRVMETFQIREAVDKKKRRGHRG